MEEKQVQRRKTFLKEGVDAAFFAHFNKLIFFEKNFFALTFC
jgi:hypothetical protein